MHLQEPRRPPEHEHWHELVKGLRSLGRLLGGKLDKIQSTLEKHPSSFEPTLGAYISAVHGKRYKMAVSVPVPKLLDTEMVQLSVMPRKADGHVDSAAVITWATSDAAQIGASPGRIVEIDGVRSINTDPFIFNDPKFGEDVTVPAAFNCVATTPNASGTATVTASASGYESAEFGPISYEAGVARSLNASVGSAMSDL